MTHYIWELGNITKRYEHLPAGEVPGCEISTGPNGTLHLYLWDAGDDKRARSMFVDYFRKQVKAAKHTPIYWVKEDK